MGADSVLVVLALMLFLYHREQPSTWVACQPYQDHWLLGFRIPRDLCTSYVDSTHQGVLALCRISGRHVVHRFSVLDEQGASVGSAHVGKVECRFRRRVRENYERVCEKHAWNRCCTWRL